MRTVTIVAISDTHNQLDSIKIPDGDILIHAGDLTGLGREPELRRQLAILDSLPHKNKVFIAGNHDRLFETHPKIARAIADEFDSITYLEDEQVEVQGVKIYGSPWTPMFCYWAFMKDRGSLELAKQWRKIPRGLDILITHGPPYGMLDSSTVCSRVGCELLRDAVLEKKPKFHVFGHIHRGHGIFQGENTTFVNAAICTEEYDPLQPVQVFEVQVD